MAVNGQTNLEVLEEIKSELASLTNQEDTENNYTLNIQVLNAILNLLEHIVTQSSIAGEPINSSCGSMVLIGKDLDNYKTSGFYNALQCQNTKYEYATMFVIGYVTPGYCTQIQYDASSASHCAVRSLVNNTWTDWYVYTGVDG